MVVKAINASVHNILPQYIVVDSLFNSFEPMLTLAVEAVADIRIGSQLFGRLQERLGWLRVLISAGGVQEVILTSAQETFFPANAISNLPQKGP